jgi:hypothetical protein
MHQTLDAHPFLIGSGMPGGCSLHVGNGGELHAESSCVEITR